MKTVLEIEPAYVEPLRAAGLADFDAIMRAAATGPAASRHKYRETVPLEILIYGKGKRFFLKRVFRVPPRHAIGPWLRLRAGYSQPRGEWEMLWRLDEAGIPTMKRVAIGEECRSGIPTSAFLLIEAVPMQFTLEDWLVPGFMKPLPRLGPRDKSRLFYDLGRQFMRLHGGGFRWPDIHPKHIFAEPVAAPREGRTWEFCLIDVERMTHRDAPPGIELSTEGVPIDSTAIEELNRLLRNLRPLAVSRGDLLRFWTGYCSGSRGLAGRKLRRGSHWLPTWATVDDRPRLPDDFEHPRVTPFSLHNQMRVHPQAISMLASAGINAADDAFELQNGENLRKPGLAAHRDRIRLQVSNGDGAPHTAYLKRYRRPPGLEQLRRMLTTGPFKASAEHESRFLKKLSLLGIPTTRQIAYAEEMTGPWEERSFIITEGLNGVSLERLLQQATTESTLIPSFDDRREITRQLAIIVRLLHHNHLYHRDLYLSHVFLTRNADGQIVLRLIDLARMIERPLRPRRWRIKDLAALDYSATALVTRADRLRFLKIYAGPDASRDEMKRDIRGIRARVRRITRHDARRARLTTEVTENTEQRV